MNAKKKLERIIKPNCFKKVFFHVPGFFSEQLLSSLEDEREKKNTYSKRIGFQVADVFFYPPGNSVATQARKREYEKILTQKNLALVLKNYFVPIKIFTPKLRHQGAICWLRK